MKSYIKFKNILSYGNKPSIFKFNNGIDIIVAENGSGKSVLLDAINYNLFGKPYRNIKLSSLINNINNKELYTEFVFNKNGKWYKVIRGMKPNIFEIYEYKDKWKLLSQHGHSKDYQNMLETIIGLNESMFKQLVALGTNLAGTKNFFELSQKDKEKMFQKLTGTYIINLIIEVTKQKRKEVLTEKQNLDYKLNLLKSNLIQLESHIENLEKQNKIFIENKEKNIQKIKNKIKKLKEKKYKLLSVKNIQEYQNKLQLLYNQQAELKAKLNQPSIKCPKCGYTNEEELKSIQEKIQKVSIAIAKLNEIIEAENEKKRENEKMQKQKEKDKVVIKELENKIKEIEEYKPNEIDYSILDKTKDEIKEVEENINEVNDLLSKYDRILSLLQSEQFKEQLLREFLPLFNKYVNEFLQKYELNYIINIDNNFKEHIFFRNEKITFGQLSNGQKQRVILSFLFSFLKLMEHNGYQVDFLILDEFLDSSMDKEGIEKTIQILKEIGNKDIIIISHNDKIINFIDPDRVFEVTKEFNFSKLELKS